MQWEVEISDNGINGSAPDLGKGGGPTQVGKNGKKKIHQSLCFKSDWKVIRFAQFSN